MTDSGAAVRVAAGILIHNSSFDPSIFDFAIRVTTGQDDGTRLNNILKLHQMPTSTIQITKAGSLVNI
jgi:hypothetical protein